MPERLSNILITLTNTILGIIGFFIVMRVILRLFSANPATPIVSWIYDVSAALIYPFIGIFPDINAGIGILDIVALVALIGYLLLGTLLAWVFRTLIFEAVNHAHVNTHYHNINHRKHHSK